MLAICPIYFYLLLLIIIYMYRVGHMGWTHGRGLLCGLLSRIEPWMRSLGRVLQLDSINIQYVHLSLLIPSLSRTRMLRFSLSLFLLIFVYSRLNKPSSPWDELSSLPIFFLFLYFFWLALIN